MSQGQFLSNCAADAMSQAAQIIMNGSLVAFPTETVYGLGADATNKAAVARIYKVKGRPQDHPLIVHISDMQAIAEWAVEIPDYAIDLARNFWPGPMTLIFKRSELAEDFITGGQDTVGLRVPDHTLALALLNESAKLGVKGIAAPSANRFGNVSPTTAQAVSDELSPYLEDGDTILDGGSSNVGVESTIIDCTGELPRILRPGAITVAMIEEVAGLSVAANSAEEKIRVSGSLESHYAPKAEVILNTEPQAGDGFIALHDVTTPEDVIRLAAPLNDDDFARVLYEALRSGDSRELKRIVVQEPQGEGIAVAIRDRLKRASQGR